MEAVLRHAAEEINLYFVVIDKYQVAGTQSCRYGSEKLSAIIDNTEQSKTGKCGNHMSTRNNST